MSNNTFSNAPATDPGPIDIKKMLEVIERCPKPVVYIQLPILARTLDGLRRDYEFRDGLTRGFLLQKPTIIHLLESATDKLHRYFGAHLKKLALSLFVESHDMSSAMLFIAVVTDLDAEQAHRILDRLDEEWFIAMASSVDGKVNIELEYA